VSVLQYSKTSEDTITNHSLESVSKVALLFSISHYSLVKPRNIYPSITKKRTEAYACHDVGVLRCYAEANNCTWNKPLISLGELMPNMLVFI
jgi:hypothetical protein